MPEARRESPDRADRNARVLHGVDRGSRGQRTLSALAERRQGGIRQADSATKEHIERKRERRIALRFPGSFAGIRPTFCDPCVPLWQKLRRARVRLESAVTNRA